jgi:glutamine amidotransferase
MLLNSSSLKIAIIDYGMGNIASVKNAIHAVCPNAIIDYTADQNILEKADFLVLPGQGAMKDCMEQLTQTNLIPYLKNVITQQIKPLLGICVGYQMLFQGSTEGVETDNVNIENNFSNNHFIPALGILNGVCERFQPTNQSIKVPQIGWNKLNPQDEFVYFVHSYAVPVNASINQPYQVLATTEYAGLEYISMVKYGTTIGCQFHPEKSGVIGLNLLKQFFEKSL